MINAHIPILGFAAASGTGKTTLLTRLIPLLRQHGFRVGLIKHSHHSFEIDKQGKDSFRLREAGASPVMLISRKRRAIITEFDVETEPRLADQLRHIDQSKLDIILVEGFKSEPLPKIELHRGSLRQPLLYPDDTNIIAIASDTPLNAPSHLEQLDINRPELVANFIMQHFLNNK